MLSCGRFEISDWPEVFSEHCFSFESWWELKTFGVFESNPVLCERKWDLRWNL